MHNSKQFLTIKKTSITLKVSNLFSQGLPNRHNSKGFFTIKRRHWFANSVEFSFRVKFTPMEQIMYVNLRHYRFIHYRVSHLEQNLLSNKCLNIWVCFRIMDTFTLLLTEGKSTHETKTDSCVFFHFLR